MIWHKFHFRGINLVKFDKMWKVISIFFKGKEGEYPFFFGGKDSDQSNLMKRWQKSLESPISDEEIFLWSNRVEPKNVEKLISDFIESENHFTEVLSIFLVCCVFQQYFSLENLQIRKWVGTDERNCWWIEEATCLFFHWWKCSKVEGSRKANTLGGNFFWGLLSFHSRKQSKKYFWYF